MVSGLRQGAQTLKSCDKDFVLANLDFVETVSLNEGAFQHAVHGQVPDSVDLVEHLFMHVTIENCNYLTRRLQDTSDLGVIYHMIGMAILDIRKERMMHKKDAGMRALFNLSAKPIQFFLWDHRFLPVAAFLEKMVLSFIIKIRIKDNKSDAFEVKRVVSQVVLNP